MSSSPQIPFDREEITKLRLSISRLVLMALSHEIDESELTLIRKDIKAIRELDDFLQKAADLKSPSASV